MYKICEIIDRKELAKRLGVTYRTIINLENSKKIKGFKIGRLIKYDFNEVITCVKNKITFPDLK
jgi:excisionase family DNA binding protein